MFSSIQNPAEMFGISLHGKLILLAMAAFPLLSARAYAAPLLLCGADEVFLIDTGQAAKGTIEKLWSWRAKDHEELPQNLHSAFDNTDDCKPIDGGTKILISSSSGACALVERPSGRVLWYAHVTNAHSLELLPHERIIAADAGGPISMVNDRVVLPADIGRLILFDIAKPDQPLWETPMDGAHGVVWDARRKRLWALGTTELRCYELKDWDTAKPSLRLEATYPLPGKGGGHDLQAMPTGNDLVVSTGEHVYLFDRETFKFRPHPDLADKANVKCISIHPGTGRVVYIYGDNEHWWTDTLHLLEPAEEIKLPGERLYKGRWMPEAAGR